MKWGEKKDLRMSQKLTWCVGYSYLRNAISMWCGEVCVNKATGERQEDKREGEGEREMKNPCRYVKPPGSIAWRRGDKKEGD